MMIQHKIDADAHSTPDNDIPKRLSVQLDELRREQAQDEGLLRASWELVKTILGIRSTTGSR